VILSVPFLAKDLRQFDPALVERGHGVEASLFDGRDVLDAATWGSVRSNLEQVMRHRPACTTFHFPCNDADYVADHAFRDRLRDVLRVAVDLGLQGVVLHSNRVARTAEWRTRDLAAERQLLVDALDDVTGVLDGSDTWLGIENMPVTGNDAQELDPLWVYAEDMLPHCLGQVGITWDVCHYAYTVHVSGGLAAGVIDQDARDYPNLRDLGPGVAPLVPPALAGRLKHGHLSAFRGLADARRRTTCEEGRVPWESDVPEDRYVDALHALRAGGVEAVTLEVTEEDYLRRINLPRMLDWCERTLQTDSG
jgi:Xylose isomerase-like TIM barrel